MLFLYSGGKSFSFFFFCIQGSNLESVLFYFCFIIVFEFIILNYILFIYFFRFYDLVKKNNNISLGFCHFISLGVIYFISVLVVL